jgi:hypothetical protein
VLIIVGLIILVAALIIGMAAVLGNGGSAHPLGHGFSVLGFHVTGSAGTLFLAGIVVGAAGIFGLSLLLAGARRASRRGSSARRSLQQSRKETAAVSRDRDDLIGQRDAALANTASAQGADAPPIAREPATGSGPRNGLQLFWHRLAPWQPAAAQPDQPVTTAPAQPEASDAPDPTPASLSVPASVPASDGASAPAQQ